MLPLEDSPGSVTTATSSSTSSSASSTPDSHSHLKRRSHCTTPMLDVSTMRQLRYSPLRSQSSSPRSRSPVVGRKLSSRTLRTTAALFALVGVSLLGSFSVLVVPVDLHWADGSEEQSKYWDGRGSPMNAAPRVVFLERTTFEPIRHRILPDDPTLHSPPGDEASQEEKMASVHHDPDCVPVAKWQTQSFPNCNIIHEMDLREAADEEEKRASSLQLLGTGWFRSTWKWNTTGDASVVLKTLRLDREFVDEYYDLHRRDAVAMERLTHSPFVMNVYGYCGQSALNELADFHWDTLEKFGKNLRHRVGADVHFLKLQLAASVSVGLAHVHELDDRPSMVHYDINPRNIAIVAGGKPKLNDFNIAEFLRYNPTTNKTCGFHGRLHEPWWRAPEEVTIGNNNLLDETVDIYALGNLLFHILTTHSPRGKMKRERMDEVRQVVANGVRPTIPQEYTTSKDPSIVAIRQAIYKCLEFDPKKRPTAREIATMLINAVSEVRARRRG